MTLLNWRAVFNWLQKRIPWGILWRRLGIFLRVSRFLQSFSKRQMDWIPENMRASDCSSVFFVFNSSSKLNEKVQIDCPEDCCGYPKVNWSIHFELFNYFFETRKARERSSIATRNTNWRVDFWSVRGKRDYSVSGNRLEAFVVFTLIFILFVCLLVVSIIFFYWKGKLHTWKFTAS